MRLRQAVFVVEQNCPYQDADDKDVFSHHLLGYDAEKKLVAYLRLVQPGVSYKEMSFGRIVTTSSQRRKGLGKSLMYKGIEEAFKLYNTKRNRISAQTHLVPFYQEFGFKSTGKEYLEDDIPHTEMLLED
jgi:ElaA protein